MLMEDVLLNGDGLIIISILPRDSDDRHGGMRDFRLFWRKAPNPHILSDRQTVKSWDLNVYDTIL
jgi:hypothetical protein